MDKLAVFDLDGTLYKGNIVTGFLNHHRKHKVNRLRLYTYFAYHSLLVPLWKIGLISEMSMRGAWAGHLSWVVSGMSIGAGNRCFKWITENYVLPLVRQDLLQLAMQLKEDGYRVILLSGTPAPLLKTIAQTLGFTEWVGTPLGLTNGKYNGRVEGPVAQGDGKAERLKIYLGDGAVNVDWLASRAYADSITDEPLLSLFGQPVAVYPDPRLAAIAEKYQWTIYGEVRDPRSRKVSTG